MFHECHGPVSPSGFCIINCLLGSVLVTEILCGSVLVTELLYGSVLVTELLYRSVKVTEPFFRFHKGLGNRLSGSERCTSSIYMVFLVCATVSSYSTSVCRQY